MENFIVSARKYRPQTFDTVVGQHSITATLKNAILNNQLAQAFLFCGPRGIGKTTCARILAKTINCENLSPNAEACDQCPSCVSFNENASFNIYELDGASNNSVDEIRNLVDRVRIPPQMGKFKVYIIDEVHMLSSSAFNAFLKTLEEPPAYAKFILATTEKHKIIPTILSRCQIFDFKRITVDDIVGHLTFVASHEGIEAEPDALHIIAQKADGAMRDALTIFDQLVSFSGKSLTYENVLENLNVLDFEYYFRITDQVLQGDVSSVLLTVNEIIEKGFDGQHFLVGFGEHMRNLLVAKDPATVQLMETAPSIRNRYLEQSERCNAAFLMRSLDLANRCDLGYKSSNNKRLHLELALMQMCGADAAESAEAQPKEMKFRAPVAAAVSAPVVKKAEDPIPAPAAKAPEPVKPKETKGFPGTISIKAAKPKPEEQKPDPAAVAEMSETYAVPTAAFTQEELEKKWDTFAESLHEELPHMFNILHKYRPVLKEDYSVEFCVDNTITEGELHQKKNELIAYLKQELNNGQITLKTVIPEVPRGSRPYTDKEKFQYLAGKNPNMLGLKEQLDLDID
jgi:DNA polymerase III subunit gamma/tau